MGRIKPPTPMDVFRAADVLKPLIRKTPLVPRTKGSGLLKLETLQITGAYKVRGATHAIHRLSEEGKNGTIVAASAGNHAAAVAWASRKYGFSALTIVPKNAPISKIARTRTLGATVRLIGDQFEESNCKAIQIAEQPNCTYLHPYDNPDVICGQGSVGVELRNENIDVVLVPIGGGGLAAGVALALADTNTKVYGVQIEGVDAMRHKLMGKRHHFRPRPTIADGIRVQTPGVLTAKICDRLLAGIILVKESEVLAAMRSLAEEDRIIAEGAGAVAVAGMNKISAKRKVAVVSGGNVDMEEWTNLWSYRAA